MKTVSQTVKNIKINAVRRTKNGIFVETATKQDLNLLNSSGAMTKAGLTATVAEPSSAKLLIFNVPGGMTENEILKDIYSKNLADKQKRDEFLSGVTLSKRKPNGEDGNRLLQ